MRSVLVDDDAAALADVEAGGAGEVVAGTDAGREHEHVGRPGRRGRRRRRCRCETQPSAPATISVVGVAEVHVHAERLDLAPQGPAAAVVDLHRHEPRGELDDVRLEPHGPQGVGRLEPEQPAADHRADRRARAQRRVGDGLEIVDGAVDERAADVAAR